MRYAVFAGPEFYPRGGWSDHLVNAETQDAAEAIARASTGDGGWWWHVVDMHTGVIVAEFEA